MRETDADTPEIRDLLDEIARLRKQAYMHALRQIHKLEREEK